jgi:signal transduction histidine kinase
MSLSYQIIKIHSGRLSINSKEGEGTTIKIKLPSEVKEKISNNNSRISIREKIY